MGILHRYTMMIKLLSESPISVISQQRYPRIGQENPNRTPEKWMCLNFGFLLPNGNLTRKMMIIYFEIAYNSF